jgi:hypothetical protein
VVLVAALVFGFLYNEANYWVTRAHPLTTPGIFEGATIRSVDTEYYLTPPENWLAGKGWCRSPCLGEGFLVRRTPGYSVWYLLFRAPLGLPAGLFALRTAQVLLFALAALAFFRTLGLLGLRRRCRMVVGLLYVLLPVYASWAYYTLTEGISISLVTLATYCLLSAPHAVGRRREILYVVGSFLAVAATLTRPMCGVILAAIPLVLWVDYRSSHDWRRVMRAAALSAVLPVLMWGSWVARNYTVTGDVVLLERYMDPESYDIVKPASVALWRFLSASGASDAAWTAFRAMLVSAQEEGRRDSADADVALRMIPEDARRAVGPTRLAAAVYDLQRTYAEIYAPYFATKNRPLPSAYDPRELALAGRFAALRADLVANDFRIFARSKLHFLRNIVVHSNSAHVVMLQEPLRSRFPVIKGVLTLMVLWHVALYALFFVGSALAWRRLGAVRWLIFYLPPLVLILSIVFVFEAFEQRYTHVVEPLMLLGVSAWLLAPADPAGRPSAG